MRYHDKPGLSFHALRDLGVVSPLFYYRSHVTKELAPKRTAAMDFGEAVHIACLEPKAFVERVTQCPDEFLTEGGDLSRSKAAKAWRATLPEGAIVLSVFDIARAWHMAEQVRQHHQIAQLLEGATCEAEHFPVLPNGMQAKAKVDMHTKENEVWDLKTIKSLNLVRDHVRDFCYVEQVTWYAWLLKAKVGGLIFVESEEPHRVQLVPFSQCAIDHAMNTWRSWLAIYTACQEANQWPNHPSAPLLITAKDLA